MRPRVAFLPFLVVCLAFAGIVDTCSFACADEPVATDSHQIALEKARASLEERIHFSVTMYGLDAGQTQLLRSWADPLLSAQVAYVDEHAVTLRRREQALATMIHRMQTVTEDVRQQVRDRMQAQIYRIHAQAPLSLANVVKQVESRLSADAIQGGREVISKKYAAALNGEPLAIDEIDRLLIPPVSPDPDADPVFSTMPSAHDSSHDVESATKKPILDATSKASLKAAKQEKLAAREKAMKAGQPATAIPPAVKEVVKAPKPLAPAPEVESWNGQVDAAVTRFGFDEIQRRLATSVLKNCKGRATQYLNSNKAAYDAARKLAEDGERRRTLNQLNERIDKLYSEMQQRIESIATIEQVNRAASADTSTATSDGTSKAGS